MKTLFLGSSGFVGSALIESLKTDNDLTVLVRKETQSQEFPGSIILGDLLDDGTLELLSRGKFQRVIDCSWMGLPDLSQGNNIRNFILKKSIIKAITKMEVKEYVGFGSCLEYGDLRGVANEDHIGINVEEFGRVKLQVLNLLENEGIKFKWFRPFYLIGSRQHKNSLLNTAIRTIEQGIDFIPRDSSKSFDFIDISQAASVMKLVIENPHCSGIYNIGSGETRSVNAIVNSVRRAFGMQEIEEHALEGLSADIGKVQLETGWKPSKKFDVSLQEIISKLRVH
jgi:nucleoside-diphosphate-sugar epimerase